MEKTQTSRNSWRSSLNGILARLDDKSSSIKLAIVGIGNELKGDDAAGVIVANKLSAIITGKQNTKVFLAGQALENITGALIRYKPEIILFIDAISVGKKPGTIDWLDWQLSSGFSASTHSLPLHVVVEYLQHELACQVYLLGIQVKDTSLDSPVSLEIKSASTRIIHAIRQKMVLY